MIDQYQMSRTGTKEKTYESNDIWMIERAKQFELLDIHWNESKSVSVLFTKQERITLTSTQPASELRDGNLSSFEFANVNILEPTTPNLLEFGQLLQRYLPVFQP